MSDPSPLTTADLVAPQLALTDRQEVIRHLVRLLHAQGRVTDAEGFLDDVAAREGQLATGMPGQVGLPHARSAHVRTPSLAVATTPHGVDFQGPDGPAQLVFLIAAPESGEQHMNILSTLARKLVHASFRDEIRAASGPEEIASVVDREVGQE